MWYINLVCFFLTKTMGFKNNNFFCIVWQNTALDPGTRLPHIICAGIGPLQLGVVLVLIFFTSAKTINYDYISISPWHYMQFDTKHALFWTTNIMNSSLPFKWPWKTTNWPLMTSYDLRMLFRLHKWNLWPKKWVETCVTLAY